MASPSIVSEHFQLRFGVEIEVIVSRKAEQQDATDMDDKNQDGWTKIANELSNKLSQKDINIECRVHKDKTVPEKEKYQTWFIVQDNSLKTEPGEEKWGVELVSPILEFPNFETWQKDMDDVWQVLAWEFDIEGTLDCSTHIHISPLGRDWTMDQAKSVAKAILYFEQAIDFVMPEHRRGDSDESYFKYFRSNRNNAYCKETTTLDIFAEIDKAQNKSQVINYMCSESKNALNIAGRGLVPTYQTGRNFRWNFGNIGPGKPKGTIEFRQPPASSSTADTKLWIMFTALFIQAAVCYWDTYWASPNKQKDDTSGSLEALQEFLIMGAELAGMKDKSLLNKLLAGAKQS